jgi:hypothetical protein
MVPGLPGKSGLVKLLLGKYYTDPASQLPFDSCLFFLFFCWQQWASAAAAGQALYTSSFLYCVVPDLQATLVATNWQHF